MSLRIARRPAAYHLQLAKPSFSSSRTFSASSSRGEEDGRSDEPSSSDRDARRRYVIELLQGSQNRAQQQARAPPRIFNPRRNNSDASRNLRALRPAQANEQSVDVGANRSPNQVSHKVLQFKQRLQQQGNRGPRGASRTRGPPGDRRGDKRGAKKRGRNSRSRDTFGKEEEKDEIAPSIQEYIREIGEKARRVPVRYNPAPYTADELKETWPALPTSGNAASVRQTVMWMSDVYTGSYNPVPELAKRVRDGDRVLFADDAEREATMKWVKEMAAEEASKGAEKSGDADAATAAAVEPAAVNFEAVSEKERKYLIDTLVRGGYEDRADSSAAGNLPILASVARSLSTNSTYGSESTGKLLAQLAKGLPAAKPAAKKPAVQ